MKAPSKKHTISQILARLQQARRIVITAHARPDGDALGSAMALGMLLRNYGAEVAVALDAAELSALKALDGTAELTAPRLAAEQMFDLFVILDSGTLDRIPEPLQPLATTILTINIDHHLSNTLFGELNWVDAKSSSCGEMVWRLARKAGWPLTRPIAEALWVAIVTDTGRFAYDNTNIAALRCAAALLRHQVRTAWLNDQIYGQFDLRVLRLRQRAYSSLESWFEGRVAVVSLSAEDFAATGCSKADADDIIEIPRALRGAQMALFFYQTESGAAITRLSLRARPPLEALALARHYGGGGHRLAAGCSVEGGLVEARVSVKSELKKLIFND